jgi:hypothetical protein
MFKQNQQNKKFVEPFEKDIESMPTVKKSFLAALTKNPFFTVVFLGSIFFYLWDQNYPKLLYLSFVFLVIMLLEYVKSLPFVQEKLQSLSQDEKNIQEHWVQDKDLIIVTWVTRCLYGLGVICYFSIFAFLQTLPMGTMFSSDANETVAPIINNLLTLGHVCVFIATILNIGFGLHIVNYRNTPTQNFLLKSCEICVKFGAAGLGVATFGAAGVSLLPGSDPTPIGNAVQKYMPGIGRGYAYESGQQHIQDGFLKLVPGYRSQDMIGENLTLSQQKIKAFVSNNEPLIRKELSTIGCQAVGLTKSRWMFF